MSPAARAASLAATRAAAPADGEVWVFAYASLMWNPCFTYCETRKAVLHGYARRFCIWTALARGTPERPGLGLGLEAAAASCSGLAFRLTARDLDAGLQALWEREMLTGIYAPCWLELATDDGPVTAIAFVVDPSRPQYAGTLSPERAAAIIASAEGKFGSCRDYLENTVTALREAGFPDPDLEALEEAVRRLD